MMDDDSQKRMQLALHQVADATIIRQGNFVEIRTTAKKRGRRYGGTRGRIKTFSRAARLRLLATINKIDWRIGKFPVMITLTYPDGYIGRKMADRTNDRENFISRVERYLGVNVTGIWRIEWQQRKSGARQGIPACHIHIVLTDLPWLHYSIVNDFWRQVIGYKGKHLSTDIRAKPGVSGAMYAVKYCAKPAVSCSLVISAYLRMTGRHYGFVRKKNLPWHPKQTFDGVTLAELDYANFLASKKFNHVERGNYLSTKMFGSRAAEFFDAWKAFCLDDDIAEV